MDDFATEREQALCDITIINRRYAEARAHLITARKIIADLHDHYGLDDTDDDGTITLLNRTLGQSAHDVAFLTELITTMAELES